MTLQDLRAGQQASGTQLLLLSGLLDELRSPSLPEGCEPAVLHAAAQEASFVPGSLAPSALAKVLTATVRFWCSHAAPWTAGRGLSAAVCMCAVRLLLSASHVVSQRM